MSLYGGITFDDGSVQPESNLASSASSTAVVTPNSTSASTSAQRPPPAAAAGTATWSSALKFAPIVRKVKKPSNNASTIPLAFRNSLVEDVTVAPGNSGTRIVGPAKSSIFDNKVPAAPSLPPPPTTSSSLSSTPIMTARAVIAAAPTTESKGWNIPQAPAMTLDDEDINGFRQTTKGKQAGTGKNAMKRKRGGPDPALAYNDVMYDPARPCDYSSYKAHLKAVKAQRRIEREAELRRARSPSGSSYTGSSEDEEEDDKSTAQDNDASKKARFAPPASYDSPHSSTVPSAVTATLMNPEESGEAAYLRRLAMSAAPATQPAPPPPPPVQARPPPSFFLGASASASTYSAPSTSFVPPSHQSSMPPPPPSFVPPPVFAGPVLPSVVAPGPIPSPSTSSAISEATARAQEIALRFGKLAKAQPPVTALTPMLPIELDDRPFAERMMESMNWKQGEGLGKQADGRIDALTVFRGLSKNYKGKHKEVVGDVERATGMGKARGAIIDSTRESRIADESKRFGEPSRVVVLTNLTSPSEVDDELGDEVATEANTFAVVERAFVFIVPGERRDDEAVRIFLVMSGIAGGYNVVKKFDGRHFAARTVKARFYDEAAFAAGRYCL